MTDNLKTKYGAVCEAPGGSGFRVEHMPDLFKGSEVDDCAPHVHSFYEILWFKEGHGHHSVDFVDYEVKPNTIFFLSPGQVHHFDVKEGYEGLTIKMCTDFMHDDDSSDGVFMKYTTFHTSDTAPYFTVDDAAAKVLSDIVGKMEEEACHTGEFGNTDILKSLLCIFLVKIQRHGKRENLVRLDVQNPAHQLFIQFRKMVELEYDSLHTVQEYADRLDMAVRTLNRSVNLCSGKAPLSFINDRIILEAKRLVRYSNMMFKEIAFELGYDDPSYFVKFFKRQTGYLPSDFRALDGVRLQKV